VAADDQPQPALVYANWVRLVPTPFDLALDVGYNTQSGPPDAFPARVVMSWEHALVLNELLLNALADYKKQAGELRTFEGTITEQPLVVEKKRPRQARKRAPAARKARRS